MPALCVATLLLVACQQATLLEGLDERQANEVVASLLHDNIDASKEREGKTGYAVRVDASDLAGAIDLIHRAELPAAPRRAVAADFSADSMVSTPQAERIRLLSSIEQRLEESLTQFTGVLTSRVHVSYPTDSSSLRARDAQAAHISALLVLDGSVDESALVQSVKRLLRNSFDKVAYDDISVVITHASVVRPTAPTPHADSMNGRLGWAAIGLVSVGLVLLALAMIRRHPGVKEAGNRWWRRLRRKPVTETAP